MVCGWAEAIIMCLAGISVFLRKCIAIDATPTKVMFDWGTSVPDCLEMEEDGE